MMTTHVRIKTIVDFNKHMREYNSLPPRNGNPHLRDYWPTGNIASHLTTASTSMPAAAAASATSSSFDDAVSSIVSDTTSAGKSSEEDRIQDILSENLEELQVDIILANKSDPVFFNIFLKVVHNSDKNHTQFTSVTSRDYERLLKSRERHHTAAANALKRMRGEEVTQTKGRPVTLHPEERDPKTGFRPDQQSCVVFVMW